MMVHTPKPCKILHQNTIHMDTIDSPTSAWVQRMKTTHSYIPNQVLAFPTLLPEDGNIQFLKCLPFHISKFLEHETMTKPKS